jgi:hypothetical protein
MALRNYKCEEKEKWDEGIDFTALNTTLDEKILLRVVEPKSKSGVVGVDTVKKMEEVMELENYDKGFLISRRFTDAAEQEMTQKNIQKISEERMLPFKPETLYLRINDYVNDLCKAKCGKIPKKKTDCKVYSSDYSCRVRTISDNASFHFKHGWINLLKNDLRQLLTLHNSEKAQ